MKISNRYWVLKCDDMYYTSNEEMLWSYDLDSATKFISKDVAESHAAHLVACVPNPVECLEVSSLILTKRESRVRQSRTYGIVDAENNIIYHEGIQCSYKDRREADEKLKELKDKGVTDIGIVTMTTTFQEEFYE